MSYDYVSVTWLCLSLSRYAFFGQIGSFHSGYSTFAVDMQVPLDRDQQPLWAEIPRTKTPWTETPIPPDGTWDQGQRPHRRNMGARQEVSSETPMDRMTDTLPCPRFRLRAVTKQKIAYLLQEEVLYLLQTNVNPPRICKIH